MGGAEMNAGVLEIAVEGDVALGGERKLSVDLRFFGGGLRDVEFAGFAEKDRIAVRIFLLRVPFDGGGDDRVGASAAVPDVGDKHAFAAAEVPEIRAADFRFNF